MQKISTFFSALILAGSASLLLATPASAQRTDQPSAAVYDTPPFNSPRTLNMGAVNCPARFKCSDAAYGAYYEVIEAANSCIKSMLNFQADLMESLETFGSHAFCTIPTTYEIHPTTQQPGWPVCCLFAAPDGEEDACILNCRSFVTNDDPQGDSNSGSGNANNTDQNNSGQN